MIGIEGAVAFIFRQRCFPDNLGKFKSRIVAEGMAERKLSSPACPSAYVSTARPSASKSPILWRNRTLTRVRRSHVPLAHSLPKDVGVDCRGDCQIIVKCLYF